MIGSQVATLPGIKGSTLGAAIMEAHDCQVTVFSPIVIPPSALNKPSIMKRFHHGRTCSHTSPHCSPMMITLHSTLSSADGGMTVGL